MANAKKFGTFSGVFTPSLLTILGVIMYLRLGWVVGQAGLIYTLGIILIAHVISVTTGLSLSSIATDKKIKAGGIYYMLSRSLGLPIGGAIGATIFLATALSIALYVVGFSESFLSVDIIRNTLGLEADVRGIRIAGSAIIILLTIIAFISTSLAIKVQYLVLTAIALSLASIFAGLFINTGIEVTTPSISPMPSAPSVDVLFAIFFPAVTGFTVGVAMSGDLKNPKVSIPKGTLLAIFTGLIVYAGLAVGFALFVDRELLLHDSAFLLKVAWIPVLVIGGIWGATLSSALGGILGGPRIMQALAKDKLAPHLLSKGYGVNNEPRIAIIFTFFIAWAGILLGDLNSIARVVSMFFIAAYGFINLAFALESWASTDFRPSFRVPRWVGWLGFAASIMVMMQIDILAMFIAFILIWFTWFLMKAREQTLDRSDDVWQSVWSSVVRHSIHKMDARGIQERNWKPNIMLFSGNLQTRPHLIELGQALIASHGLLTIINLRQYAPGEKARPRFNQNQQTTESDSNKGIFTREYFCHDIYHGIENLAENYGFAGVEPNTVLMGWTRENVGRERFAKLLKHLIQLDLNVLLMDYDQKKGFGKRNTIDIWWRGSGNNGNLAIHLVKFLWLSDQWKDSKTRLMIENPVNEERENIYNFAREVLDNLRVNAEIIIINNEIEKKPFYDIIRAESSESDIIFMGIPDIEDGKEVEFMEQTHALCADLGTVVLIKASTLFKRLNIGIKTHSQYSLLPGTQPAHIRNPESHPEIVWPQNPEAAAFAREFFEKTRDISYEAQIKGFGKVLNQYAQILENAQNRVNATFSIIEKKLAEQQESVSNMDNYTVFFKLTNNTFTRYEQILLSLRDQLLEEQQKNLEVLFNGFHTRYEAFLDSLPEKLQIAMQPDRLSPSPGDGVAIRLFKWRKRLKGRENATQTIRIKKLIRKYYPHTWYLINKGLWQKFSGLSLQYLIEQHKAFNQLRDSMQHISNQVTQSDDTPQLLQTEKQKIDKVFTGLRSFLLEADTVFNHVVEEENTRAIQAICLALDQVDINAGIKKQKPGRKVKKQEIRQMESHPQLWRQNQMLQINFNILELILSSVDYKTWYFTNNAIEELKSLAYNKKSVWGGELADHINQFTDECIQCISVGKQLPTPDFSTDINTDLHRKVKDIEDSTLERIQTAISRIPSHVELIKSHAAADLTALQPKREEVEKVEVSRLIHFILQSDLITPLQQNLKSFTSHLMEDQQELLEIARLVQITLTPDKEEPQQLPSADFFHEQKQRTGQLLAKLRNRALGTQDKLQSTLNKTSRQLSPTIFLKTANNLKLYVKSKETGIEKEGWIKKKLNVVYDFGRRQLVKIWFDRSRRIVYAHKIRGKQKDRVFPLSDFHAFNEAVSVKNQVLAHIPPYYQQLFLRKNNYFMDFWHGKPQELDEAQKTIARQGNGYNGALLIRGEHNSGKTFMTNYICHNYLANRQVFVVQPPFAGSCSEADFLRAFQKATEQYVSADKILKSLPEKSVIVIEDLELWWEKHKQGLKVIQFIINLIEKHGTRILFIINGNLHAFNSINRFKRMDPWMLSIIDCTPFNAEEIKNIIIQRHRSGNVKFMYNGKKEEEMRSWDYARLFNTFYNYTRGNVGLSLQAWMACIDEVKDNRIIIRTPRRPDASLFNKMNAETLIFLVQFILHKRLNIDKIQRIMLMSQQQALEKVTHLKRAAVITEPSKGVYMLNPSLHAFIRERLIEKDLL